MTKAAIPALGALIAACIAVIVAAADHAQDSSSSPLEPDGAWRAALVAAGLASFLAYAVASLALRRSRAPLVAVLVIAVVVQLTPLLGPVLLSRDVYAYWAYGRIGAVHDGNPYVDVPSAFPDDPAVQRMGTSWLETTTLYGPVWTVIAEGVSTVADSPGSAALAFRSIAALSVLAIVGLAVLLARNRPFAAAFVGWNPLLALHFAGGGHNDALMMALALGALVLGARGRAGASGLAWAGAIAVKWVAAASPGSCSSAPASESAACSADSSSGPSRSPGPPSPSSAPSGSVRDPDCRARPGGRDRSGSPGGWPTSGCRIDPPLRSSAC